MAWTIRYTESALRQLKKLDKSIALRVLDFMDARVGASQDPRSLGKKLIGSRLGIYWRYRVGDLRAICDIQDQTLVVLVIEIGHRREV